MGYYLGGALLWSEFSEEGLRSPSECVSEMALNCDRASSLGNSTSYSNQHSVNMSTK